MDGEDWDDENDNTCPECSGDGGDPWNDFILPCPKCNGEGYLWWKS